MRRVKNNKKDNIKNKNKNKARRSRINRIKERNAVDFELTEPVLLAFEREKADSKIIKKHRYQVSAFVKILRILFLLALIIAIVYLIVWWKNNSKNNKIVNELANEYIEEEATDNGETETKIDFEGLTNSNEECIGWLVVPNTKANYPVVKHSNNDYYLAHSFDKTNNAAGWIFADYTNIGNGSDKNLVIYGHNRRDGSMFGSINDVLKKEWYENEENRKITYYTKDEKIEYQIFSVYNIPVEEYFAKTDFPNDLAYRKYLETMKERSIYDFNVNVEKCTSIITVSTCGRTSESRTVIHAKKIENDNENTEETSDNKNIKNKDNNKNTISNSITNTISNSVTNTVSNTI